MSNQKLRAARERKRWTMAVAAEKIGVTEQTYSSWENGKRTPHLSTLDLLCQAFDGMAPEELGFGDLVQESVDEERNVTPFVSPPQLEQQLSSKITLLTREQVATLASFLGGNMKHFDPSKRETLEQLLKILGLGVTGVAFVNPLQRLAQVGNLLHNEEILAVSTTNVPIFWRLYFDGHLAEVGQVLPD